MNDKPNDQSSLRAGIGRNEAGEVITDSDRFFFALSQVSTVGVFRTDVHGNYLYVNERWCKIVGMKSGEALVGGWARAIHPDDRDRVAKAWYTSNYAHLNFILEYRIKRPDGEVRWVLGQAAAERDADGKAVGYVGTITDITHSRQAEEEYQKFFNLIPDLACIVSTDGRFLKINKMWQDMLGYTEQEILAIPFFDLIHPEDREATMKEVERQLAGEATLQFTNRYRCKDGSYRWLEWKATLAIDGKLLFASARDITERKHLVAEKQVAQDRLQKIIQLVPGIVYQFRLSPDGSSCVPFASEAAREIYRLDPDEVREDASKVFAYVHPDDLENFKASIQASARDLTPWQHEYRLKFDDGTVRWLFGNALPHREDSGSTLWNGFITDITARKRVEAEIFAVQSRLKATLEAIPDLLFEIGLDGRYHDYHSSHPELLAAPSEVFIGKTVYDVLPPEAADMVMLALREAYEKGNSFGRQIELYLPQGSSWFELSVARKHSIAGQEPRFIVLSRDITGRKQAEEQLRKSAEEITDLYNHAPCGYHSLDKDGVICRINDTELAWLGYTRDEVVGKMKWPDLITSGSLQSFWEDFPRFMKQGFTHDFVIEITRKGGTTFTGLINATAIYDQSGNYVMSRSTVTDITGRKQAENALAKSEERARLAISASNLALWDYDLLTGSVYLSEGWSHLLGGEQQPTFTTIQELTERVPEEEQHMVRAAILEAVKGHVSSSYQVTHRVRKLDGGYIWVLSEGHVTDRDPDGRALRMIGTNRDITERKKKDEQLRQSEAKLHAYLDNISDTIWLIDANLNMAYVSPSVTRLMSVLPEDLIGRPCALVIHPDDMGVISNAMHYVMEHPGEPHTIQYRVSHKDGRWIHVESTGVNMFGNPAINGVLITMRDVTGRKQAEADLQMREVSMRAILDNSPYLVWLKDAEGHYITSNMAHANYAHLEDHREIIGKTDFDLWPKDLAEKYRADDAEVIATRQQKHIEEPSFDGDKMHWVETFKTPIIAEHGKVLGTTGFARDISERKQSEQVLAESESRFREIFNTVNDAIFIHDAKTGRIVDVNNRMCEMYGLTHEEALACGPDDLSAGTPPYSSAEAAEKIRLARTEGPQTFDWLARAGDGHLFWVEVSLRFARIGNQQRVLAVVRDISDRKHADEEIRIAATVFESQEGMFVTDANSVILRVNHAFTDITGYAAEEAVGQTPSLLKSGRHDEAFFAAMWESIRRTGVWKGEIWNRRKNGEVYPEQLTITAVKDDAGEITHYFATMIDITERKQVEEQIHNLAFYDTLTQLPNRRMLSDRMNQAMASSKRSSRYGALLFLDLDNFKPLNDTYGHAVGDLLLKEVARRISSCVREMDTVARFGGDEFVVMLTELDADKVESTAQAGVVAEKIRACLAEPYVLKIQQAGKAETTVEHHCTSSIGVVLFINHEDSPEDILKWADMAMYQAKDDGRNLIRFHDSKG